MSSQRSLIRRIERKLEATFDDAFARIFGGSVVPEEVEALLRHEAEDALRPLHGNRFLAPNEYVITLGVHDFEKVRADPGLTSRAFARYLADYIEEQGWQTYGEVVVRFEETSSLHTGQFRARGTVNPDAKPRPTVDDAARPHSNHAFGAERGVAMTDNSSYRADQGQERPAADDYYDDRYGRPRDDSRSDPDRPGESDQRGGHPPEQGGYPPPGGYAPPRRPDQGGGYPKHGGGHPQQGGGYPEQGGGYPQQGGGYPGSYEQRPPVAGGYGAQGYDQGFRPGGGYGPPGGAPQGFAGGYGDYGRGPARGDEGGYGGPPRPDYPDQGGGYDRGYQQSGPGYGRQDYGPGGEYTQYAESVPVGGYPPQGGYAETAHRDYDYGQSGDYGAQPDYAQPAEYGDYGQQAGGYGGYGPGGYGSAGTTVTLHLDDGSGRTYQLREGSNIVGRGQDAQFRLPDTGVSRRHLEIRWDGQVALLADLNSTNGTTVNNAPVQEWQLADGDVIRLGHSEIIVRIQ